MTIVKYSVTIVKYSVTIVKYSVTIFGKAPRNPKFRFILGLDFWGNVSIYFVSLRPTQRRMADMTHLTHLTDYFTESSRVPRTHGTREKLLINVSNPSNPSILRQISGVLPRFVANSFA